MSAEHVEGEGGPVVRFEDVTFGYGGQPVLAGVSLDLAPGEVVHLLGRSGSGKTTLLRLAHGELRMRTGRVTVDGVAVHRPRAAGLRHLRRRVAFVPQDGRLLPGLTVLENVAYALRVADLRLDRREAGRRARSALCDVGMEGRMSSLPRELSAGQRQRVAVARAIASEPAVVLADEPAASLDVAAAGLVRELFERLANAGAAVLVATHDERAARRSGRVLRLEWGALIDEARRELRCAAG